MTLPSAVGVVKVELRAIGKRVHAREYAGETMR